MKISILVTAFFLVGSMLHFATAARAQTVLSEQIIGALNESNTGPRVRSMSSSAKRGIQITGELPREVDLPKISLSINFDLNSSRLTTDGMIALRSLAKAMLDERLSEATFQVAGHTDALGDAAFNQKLSERRAEAVVNHLVNWYDIDRTRLIPRGYGLSQPMDVANPLNPLNRRVEIINVDPLS